MPIPLNGATTSTSYTDAATLAYVYGGRGGRFTIESQPCYVEIAYGDQGQESWTAEQLVQPGSGSIDPGAIGIRFRSSSSQAATVSASITPPMLPGITLLSQSTVGSTMITGRVDSDGTIAAGTGFGVVHTGTGIYTVSFSTDFAAEPVIAVTLISGGANIVSTVSPSAASFQVNVEDSSGVHHDSAFGFIAQAIA